MKTATAVDQGGSGSGTGHGEPQRSPRAALIATGLTVAAVSSGVVLRWFHLEGQSLWYDEGITTYIAGLSPANIIRYAQSSDAPPLYFLLQHYWDVLFGNSEYALRAFSAFFGTLSLPVFYLLAKKVLKDSMAVALAMWVFAFSILPLWYSREVRFYSLASFFAVVGLCALVFFLERRSLGLFATIVVAVAASLYTHNTLFLYLLALNVTWLIYPSERDWRQRLKEVFLADVLVGVLYLPWVPSLLRQVARVHEFFWPSKPTISALFETLTLVAGFYFDYLAAVVGRLLPLPPHAIAVSIVGGVSLLCAALLAYGLWGVPKADRSKNVSLLLYCLVPILVVFLLSQLTTSIYIDRIFIHSSLVIPLVFAYPLARQKGRKGRILFGLLGIALGAATALSGVGYLRYQKKEDWRGAMSSVLSIPETNRLIVFAPRTGEMLFDYYARGFPVMGPGVAKMGLPISYREEFPPRRNAIPITSTNDFNPVKLAVESRRYSEIDLVLTHDFDPHGVLSDYLSQASTRQEEQQFYGVSIVRFLMPPR